MTESQKNQCAKIICSASDGALVAGAVSGFTVLGIQTKMVIDIAKVFGLSISDISATKLVKNYFSSGSMILSAISTVSWIFPPAKVVAGTIDAFKSAQKTEDLGWKMAHDFDKRVS